MNFENWPKLPLLHVHTSEVFTVRFIYKWYSGILKLSQQVFGHIQEFFQDFSFGHLTSSRLDINSLPTTNRWSISKITTHRWLSTSKITAHWWWGATKIGSKLIWFIAHWHYLLGQNAKWIRRGISRCSKLSVGLLARLISKWWKKAIGARVHVIPARSQVLRTKRVSRRVVRSISKIVSGSSTKLTCCLVGLVIAE